MRLRPSRLAAFAAAAAAALMLAACGSAGDPAQRAALVALSLKTPRPPASPPGKRVRSCGALTASLRPPAAMPAPGAMPTGSSMARIERRGYLIAGVDQNTLLFAYFNPLERHVVGLEIDLLRQIAQSIFGNANAIQFRAVTTAERIPAVEQGLVDVSADAITITCERRQQVDFSTVYYDAGQKLLVPRDSTATGLADMAGKRVCATIGSTSLQTLESLQPRAIPYPVQQRTDCLVALQEGRADAVTSDDSILLGFKAQDPNTEIIGSRFANEPYGMAINKDHPDFVRFVNGVLARMRADGSWRRIVTRWLGGLGPVSGPPPAVYSG
jgi:polar amino acid transport system substrate-binding protein